tara:strand:- start:519 stop:803 length:285 start_codon:yes stop_codon:yes gene_type:complete
MARRWNPNEKRITRPTTTGDFAGDGSHCASCSKKIEEHDLGQSDEKGAKFCLQCAYLKSLGEDDHGLVKGSKASKKFRGYQSDAGDGAFDPPPQ